VVAGVDDQLDLALSQPVAHGGVALLPRREAPLRELAQREALGARVGGGPAARAVAGHRDDPVAALGQVAQVGAPAAGEHAEAEVCRHPNRTRCPPDCSTTRPTTGKPGTGSEVTTT